MDDEDFQKHFQTLVDRGYVEPVDVTPEGEALYRLTEPRFVPPPLPPEPPPINRQPERIAGQLSAPMLADLELVPALEFVSGSFLYVRCPDHGDSIEFGRIGEDGAVSVTACCKRLLTLGQHELDDTTASVQQLGGWW